MTFDLYRGGELVPVDGEVYCLFHNGTHADDTRDPFDMGAEDSCEWDDHRKVYYRARKGDYKDVTHMG